MTPKASVAMLEKLALLKIAACKAPVLSNASACRTSTVTSTVPTALRGVVSMHLHSVGFSSADGDGELLSPNVLPRFSARVFPIEQRANSHFAAAGWFFSSNG